jgi:hypothetical protein
VVNSGGHVLQRGDEVLRLVVLVSDKRHKQSPPNNGAVLADIALLRQPGRNLTAHKLKDCITGIITVIRMSDFEKRPIGLEVLSLALAAA